MTQTTENGIDRVETLKQQLIDGTGAALWENWLPILAELMEAVEERALLKVAAEFQDRADHIEQFDQSEGLKGGYLDVADYCRELAAVR